MTAPARRALGTTGIEISRLTLGTANVGSRWGPHWTLAPKTARRLVARALERGITAIDTANVYNQGESEAWLGAILAALGARDRVVLSTKFGYLTDPAVPASGGSGRAAMHRAIERSLRRLRTDRIDILYLHLWDVATPVEETLAAAAELVAAGKIRGFGLSNVPAWYVARAALLCRDCGLAELAAVQLNYTLLTRHLEVEFRDLLRIAGIDMIAWGPLANGLLSGRYRIDPAARTVAGDGRVTGAVFTTGTIDPFGPAVAPTIAALETLARETGLGPAQLALGWLLERDPPASVVIGVSSERQLDEQLDMATGRLDADAVRRLDAASTPLLVYPQQFLEPEIQLLVHGDRRET